VSHRDLAGIVRVFGGLLLACWLVMPVWAARAASPPEMGWLGVSIADVGEELADRLATTFGPAAGNGVQVVEVLKNSPAEQAPLERGDVIVKLGAQPIWNVRQLQRVVRAEPVNQRVVLTVLRGSAETAVPITIGAMPLAARVQVASERLGFVVREEESTDRPAAAPGGRRQIVVAFVIPDSAAARAGLQPRDAILEVNGRPVLEPGDLARALQPADRPVSLVIERLGASAPLSLTLQASQP
jgi:serine protease Do